MRQVLITLLATMMILGCSNGDKVIKNGDPAVIHQIAAADGSNVIAWTVGDPAYLKPVDGPYTILIIRIDGTQAVVVKSLVCNSDALLKPLSNGMVYQEVDAFDFGPETEPVYIGITSGQMWQHDNVPVVVLIGNVENGNIILSFKVVGTAFSLTTGALPTNIMTMLSDGWTLMQ